MLLSDTHCHLDRLGTLEEIHAAIERALEAGVQRILVPGTDLASSKAAINLAETYPQVYAAVGNHPNDGEAWHTDTLQELQQLTGHPKVVAIGEIGLDFYRPYTPHPLQREILLNQLQLAKSACLPVIIHSRQSLPELLHILSAWTNELRIEQSPLAERPGVLHSFDGDPVSAATALGYKFMLGISGPVTYRNAQDRQELVQNLPLESILIETDSPYLTPHPHRGKANEPSFVRFTAEKIAELHYIPVQQLAMLTWQNAERQFIWGAMV